LDGSLSDDPDGSIASYDWSEASTSLGSGVNLVSNFAVGTHTVTLTVTDNEGATDTDDVIITINPDPSGSVFFDDFENGFGKWTESNEFDWTIEPPKERSVPGNPSPNLVAHADNCDKFCVLTVASPIDLSSYTGGTLSFWRFVDGSLDNNEYLEVNISNNGGATWDQIFYWTNNNGDTNAWTQETYDLTGYLTNDFMMQFISKESGKKEEVEIDDVLIDVT